VVVRLVGFGAWTIADQKRIQLAKAPAKDSNTKSNAAARSLPGKGRCLVHATCDPSALRAGGSQRRESYESTREATGETQPQAADDAVKATSRDRDCRDRPDRPRVVGRIRGIRDGPRWWFWASSRGTSLPSGTSTLADTRLPSQLLGARWEESPAGSSVALPIDCSPALHAPCYDASASC
jgi:hypothetical protein